MAIGGIDSDWARVREDVTRYFPGGLTDYIQDSLDHPVPGEGKCPLRDPLYDRVRETGLSFSANDEGQIRALIEDQQIVEGRAIRLSSNDPWIAKVSSELPGVFDSRHDEYFLFPLVPLGVHKQPALLGFVIADLSYAHQPHTPGANAPDLGMVALILNLISAMWAAREDSESYLHALFALPVLRHNAPHLDQIVGLIADDVRVDAPKRILEERLQRLIPLASELQQAASIVDAMRTAQMALSVENGQTALSQYKIEAMGRHSPTLHCELGNIGYQGRIQVPPHIFESILDCLIDNAVCSTRDSGRATVRVVMDVELVEVSESNHKRTSRVLIRVRNDGPPIPANLAPFLFVDRVSTHQYGGKHRGTGLSTARLQAKAYGGDVMLLSSDPVCFGLVLSTMVSS